LLGREVGEHFVAIVRRPRVTATKRTVEVHNVAAVGAGAAIATKPTPEEGFVATIGAGAAIATKPTPAWPLPYPAAVDVRGDCPLGVALAGS
jgi:hypothetical protein